jgi:hypothetical protein
VTIFAYVGGSIGSPINDLGEAAIRLPLPPLTERAEALDAAMSGLVVDDDAGSLDVPGLRAFAVNETDCSVGRLYSGYVTNRHILRGDDKRQSLRISGKRQWDVDLVDYNMTLSRRVIRGSGGNRPAETDVERVQWIIASDFTPTVTDAGLIQTSGPVDMDPVDYRGRYPTDVLADCGNASGKNYFVYFDEPTNHPAFAYFFGTSTLYSSTLRLSNVASDIDSSTTFAATCELYRDPSRVFSGVYLKYDGGAVFRSNSTTEAAFQRVEVSIDEPDIKSSTKATALADKYLTDGSAEDETLTITLQLPSTHVNLVQPGQRIQVKFSHIPGYTSFTYTRVVSRTVSQAADTDKVYDVVLECKNPKLIGRLGTGSSPVSAGTGNNQIPPTGQPIVITTCADKPATSEAVATHDITLNPGDPSPPDNLSGWSTTAIHPTPGNYLTAELLEWGTGPGSVAAVGVAPSATYNGALWCCTFGFGEPGTLSIFTTTSSYPTIVHSPAIGTEVCLLGWEDVFAGPTIWHAWPADGTLVSNDGFGAGRDAAWGLSASASFQGAGLTWPGPFRVRIREYAAVGPAGAPALGQPSGEQTPTPAPDGVTTTFTTPANFVSGTLRVEVDGLDQTDAVTSATANTFTLSFAPESDETVRVWYSGAGTG